MTTINWYLGPCHPVTRLFGVAEPTVFGPVEVHTCQTCGNHMIHRPDKGWMTGADFKMADPKHCAQISALSAIEPRPTRMVMFNV